MRQMLRLNRRDFLGMAALGAVTCTVARPGTAHAIDPIGRTRPSHFKLSLAAYSYRDYLAGPEKRMDLFDFVNLAADLGLDAVEPTAYYFPRMSPPTTCTGSNSERFCWGWTSPARRS